MVAGDSRQFDTRYDMNHLGSSIDQAFADFTDYLSSHPENEDEVVQLAWIEDMPTLGQVANGNDTDFRKTYLTPSFFGGLCGNSPTSHSMTPIRSSASTFDTELALATFMAKVNEDVRTFGPSARKDGKLY